MTDARAHLLDLAQGARLAHGAVAVRVLALMVLGWLAQGPIHVAPALIGGVGLGLALLVLLVVVVATRSALRAGLGQAAMRVWGAVAVWGALVLVAQVTGLDDGRSFVEPASIATDLAWLAWCSLLGHAVRAAGAPDAMWLRATAYGWLVLHAVMSLLPLAALTSFGMTPIMVVSVASAVVPYGAALVDAERLLRATRAARHAVPALAEPDAQGDAPWRPGG